MLTIRHWRGHGIHSPFMYRFVREVLMDSGKGIEGHHLPLDTGISDILKRDLLLLKKLWIYLDCPVCCIAGDENIPQGAMVIVPASAPQGDLRVAAERIAAAEGGGCLVALGVSKSREKYLQCRAMVKDCDCVKVDMFRVFIFFFDTKLHSQYFRIKSNII